MTPEPNIFKWPYGTKRLREIRDAGLACIGEFKDQRFMMIDKVQIHFFNDCCLVVGYYQQGVLTVREGETLSKTFTAYTKDMKTWSAYTNQFEPMEGYHQLYEYKPHNSLFPL